MPLLDVPFAFFGHSLGALVAFETARWLQRRAGPAPVRLFASGCRGPLCPRQRKTFDLPDSELIETIRSLDGTPGEVAADHDLMKLLLPRLRTDLQSIETYSYVAGPRLSCPFAVYGGHADPVVSPGDLEGWRDETEAACIIRLFPGGHFFLHSARATLLQSITEDLFGTVQASHGTGVAGRS